MAEEKALLDAEGNPLEEGFYQQVGSGVVVYINKNSDSKGFIAEYYCKGEKDDIFVTGIPRPFSSGGWTPIDIRKHIEWVESKLEKLAKKES